MYYEDLEVGQQWEVGESRYERDDMIGFAERYDPEPFHIDQQWSKQGPFGDIIASGVHTLGKCRFLDQVYFAKRGSKGLVAMELSALTFPNPAYPGDTIQVFKRVADKRASRSNRARGIVTFDIWGINQHQAPLIEYTAVVLFERRPGDPIG